MKQLLSFCTQFIDWIISPPFCEDCSIMLERPSVLCDACCAQLPPIVSVQLPITKTYAVPVYALTGYDGVIKRLIRAKHHGSMLASTQLGELLSSHHILTDHPDALFVPVPLHWSRRWLRGYNQAHEMAQILAKKSSGMVLPVVRRKRATLYQARLHAHERLDNVRSAFSIDQRYASQITGKRIVIVDDLMTTGATVREMVRVLRPLRPASIVVLVAARAL